MKKIFSFCFLVLAAGALHAQKVINDPNVEPRTVSGFHGLQVSNAFEVVLTQGNEESLAVSSSRAEDLKDIRTEVENGILKISFEQKARFWGKGRKLKAYVSVKSLDVLKASGATNIKIDGTLSASKLDLGLSGASQLRGKLEVRDRFDIDLSGASDMDISGSAGAVTIEASGASDVDAYDFQTSTCSIKASGASSIHIHVNQELNARLSGASSLSYKGAASIKEIKTSGASSIGKKS